MKKKCVTKSDSSRAGKSYSSIKMWKIKKESSAPKFQRIGDLYANYLKPGSFKTGIQKCGLTKTKQKSKDIDPSIH